MRWEEAYGQTTLAREAAEAGEKLADELRKQFTSGLKVKVDEVITARVLASQARSEYNEFVYRQLIALADLERVSGGAFRSGLQEMLQAASTTKE